MTLDLNVYQIQIEISKGDRIKRGNNGQIEFVSPFKCPFNYGSLIGILGADGDLADAILLGKQRVRGDMPTAYAVGVVRFIDKGVQDDKWILSEKGHFSLSDYAQIEAFFLRYVILKNVQHTLITGRLQSNSSLQQIECFVEPSLSTEDKSMSAFQLRRRIKDFAKGILGLEDADTSPPNWQSRPPSTPEPSNQYQAPQAEEKIQESPSDVTEPVEQEIQQDVTERVQTSDESPTETGEPLSLEAVQEVLDDMVRPALQGDGGDITLVKIEDNNIFVQLVGACSSCPSSTMTMRMGVEALLREEFPAMKELIDVTNAEAGTVEA